MARGQHIPFFKERVHRFVHQVHFIVTDTSLQLTNAVGVAGGSYFFHLGHVFFNLAVDFLVGFFPIAFQVLHLAFLLR